ncbi:four-carbon acid sugar kinase family protein [Pigmentiphaga soli]|uniref:3-oxo-tetronate kinase n=1 Tax=Pigmentiphaga soli TaxID=1007095 RepID=A0ABP8HJJ6_9BURK
MSTDTSPGRAGGPRPAGGALLGCIADDFTGATDLANNLARAGLRVVQTQGVPAGPFDGEVDAVVVALKTRTVPAAEAVAQSLQALAWLRGLGADQVYFKYCSTFDSTPAGNIGPVTEALMDALDAPFTIACPAFPEAGRTVFKGYLFVGDVLLHESGMRNHPLTPMTDSNLQRVLQAQTRRRVGLIDYRSIAAGAAAVGQRIDALRAEGIGIAIADATSDADLATLGAAAAALPLVTAGSGLAIGLAPQRRRAPREGAGRPPPPQGRRAILSGSCSTATVGQVERFIAGGGAAFRIDPLAAAIDAGLAAQAIDWATAHWQDGPVLVYATARPDEVRAAQERLGVAGAAEAVERTLAAVARGLVERGAGQLILAGGETSSACVLALEVDRMRIGPQIAPGVPWCHANVPYAPQGSLHLTLKSGNFGGPDFFGRAFAMLDDTTTDAARS